MRKTLWLSLLLLALAAACTAYRAQHRRHAHEPAPRLPREAPSAAFRALPDEGQQAVLQGEVEALKADLARRGRYACCVSPSCHQCLMDDGECFCWLDFEKGRGVCGECTQVWVEGRGPFLPADPDRLLDRLRERRHGHGRH